MSTPSPVTEDPAHCPPRTRTHEHAAWQAARAAACAHRSREARLLLAPNPLAALAGAVVAQGAVRFC